MTPGQWAFVMVRDKAGFDRFWDIPEDHGEFYFLYYRDGWREVYAAHGEEIEAEWKRRGWTQEQRRFVMTPYLKRGFRLAHDELRDRKFELWKRFETERPPGTFLEYLQQHGFGSWA
jgi:hypothetical protein